jgi:hypothetical protein
MTFAVDAASLSNLWINMNQAVKIIKGLTLQTCVNYPVALVKRWIAHRAAFQGNFWFYSVLPLFGQTQTFTLHFKMVNLSLYVWRIREVEVKINAFLSWYSVEMGSRFHAAAAWRHTKEPLYHLLVSSYLVNLSIRNSTQAAINSVWYTYTKLHDAILTFSCFEMSENPD